MRLILSDTNIENLEKDLANKNIYFNLDRKKITTCIGCFGCWVKTPSKCIMRDDAIEIYKYLAKSDKVIYISKIKYGSYDTIMKTFLERSIPIQQAFIRLHNGETHHVQRNNIAKEAVIIAYGYNSEEEKTIFSKLIDRNAHNMNFKKHKVIFTSKEELNSIVKREVV